MPIIPSYPPRKMTQNSWTPLMMLCAPFQSWTSLTKLSVILRNMDQTCSNLYGTSSAFSASSAPPDCVPKCPPLHTPPHPILPFLTYSTVPTGPKCDFCFHLGHVEAKCFLKEHLMCQHNLPSSSTASPASTSSQTHLDCLSCISICPLLFCIPA